MIIKKSNITHVEFLKYIHNDAISFSKLLTNNYLIIGINKNDVIVWCQCYFKKKHFMHLMGIKSKTLSANDFFDKAYEYDPDNSNNLQLSINDCTPSRNHTQKSLNEKASCAEKLFAFEVGPSFSIGKKEKLTEKVDFTYAYGSSAIMGFQEENNSLSYPKTILTNDINYYCINQKRVKAVLSKNENMNKYYCIVAESKPGLVYDRFNDFPKELSDLIDIENLHR